MNAIFGRALLLVMLAAPAVRADPTPEQIATARELYKQGADALDALDAKTAVEKLVAAWALVQTPVIGFDLARAQLALGHLVEAREAALAVARLPAVATETQKSQQARAQSLDIADAIAKRIAHVTIRIEGLTPDREAVVKLDGTPIPRAALAVTHQVNPGKHQITVDLADGQKREGTVSLAEGETKELVLDVPAPLPPNEQKALPPPITAPITSTAPPETHRSISPVVWIGAGVTGIGLVVGTIAGAFALSEAGAVKDRCTFMSGADFVCATSDAGHLASANTSATVSTIGFVAAGVGLATVVTGLVLTVSSGSKSARLVPFGVAGTF